MRGNDGGESHLQSHHQEQPMGGGRCRLVVEVVLSGRHTAGRAAVNLPAHPGRAPATYLRAHIPMRSRIDTPPACSIPRQRQQARTTRRTARADVVVRRQGQMYNEPALASHGIYFTLTATPPVYGLFPYGPLHVTSSMRALRVV